MLRTRLFEERRKRSKYLKDLRENADISKKKLSRTSGLDKSTIIRMEKGEESWTIDSEIQFIDAIKVIQNRP